MFSFSTDSTLQMLGTNEIQEAIHRTKNSDKLEQDLISALNHILGQSCHIGKNGIKEQFTHEHAYFCFEDMSVKFFI